MSADSRNNQIKVRVIRNGLPEPPDDDWMSLLGICLILRAVIKRKRLINVLAATLIAAIPLGYIFITQP